MHPIKAATCTSIPAVPMLPASQRWPSVACGCTCLGSAASCSVPGPAYRPSTPHPQDRQHRNTLNTNHAPQARYFEDLQQLCIAWETKLLDTCRNKVRGTDSSQC